MPTKAQLAQKRNARTGAKSTTGGHNTSNSGDAAAPAGQQQQKKAPVIRGSDNKGRRYASAEEMWAHELGAAAATNSNTTSSGDNNDNTNREELLYDREKGWYGKALRYWEGVPATVNGVLGGMEHIHGDDIAESRAFVETLRAAKGLQTRRALDCGAGIGRITRHLLAPLFETTDLMEPVPHMLDTAKSELAAAAAAGEFPPSHTTGEFMLCSMEKAQLAPRTYDLIVIQWAAIYLTDDDFVKFFAHCKQALVPETGFIFFKENCSSDDQFLVDKDDSSLTRSDMHYKLLFERAGVRVVREAKQKKWPSELLEVRMYALQ